MSVAGTSAVAAGMFEKAGRLKWGWVAHKALMETCDENARRFKDATEFFEKNLREEEGEEVAGLRCD